MHPSATAYEKDLYSFLYSAEKDRQQVEQRLFKSIDDKASLALKEFHKVENDEALDPNHVRDFALFINYLQVRCPEDIANLRRDWQVTAYLKNDRGERFTEVFDSPDSNEDPDFAVEHSMYSTLRDVMEFSCKPLMNLQWKIATITEQKYSLLTSDRPLLRTYDVSKDTATFLIPIGPRKLIVGWKTFPTDRVFLPGRILDGNHIGKLINQYVVENAVKFVYAVDDRQSRFVQNRMSKRYYSRISEDFAHFIVMGGGPSELWRKDLFPNDLVGMLKSDLPTSYIEKFLVRKV